MNPLRFAQSLPYRFPKIYSTAVLILTVAIVFSLLSGPVPLPHLALTLLVTLLFIARLNMAPCRWTFITAASALVTALFLPALLG